MKIIGLTGQSGAGKGTIAALFAEHGVPTADTDRIYHELLIPPSPCLDALRKEFSDAILNDDGTLNRAALAALVFEQTDQGHARHLRLNEITHRYVIERTFAQLDAWQGQGHAAAIIDAPLLIEADLHKKCDFVIAVLAERDVRMERLIQRDGLSRDKLRERLDAQPGDDFYLAHADAVIYNNGDTDNLRASVQNILSRIEVLL